jgi:hypothetical protein
MEIRGEELSVYLARDWISSLLEAASPDGDRCVAASMLFERWLKKRNNCNGGREKEEDRK